MIIQALQMCGLVSATNGHVQVAKASEELARFMKIKLDGLGLLPASRRAKLISDPIQSLIDEDQEGAPA